MSYWIFVLVSVERCIAIFYPLKVHLYLTLKRINILLSCLTLITCMSKLYHLLTSYIITYNSNPVCIIEGNDMDIFSILNGLLYSFITLLQFQAKAKVERDVCHNMHKQFITNV